MASVVNGIENLFASIFDIVKGLVNTLLSAFESAFALAQNLVTSIFDLMSGLVGFILGTYPSSSIPRSLVPSGR